MMLAAVLLVILMIAAARSHSRNSRASGHPKGFPAALEAVILYLRNEI